MREKSEAITPGPMCLDDWPKPPIWPEDLPLIAGCCPVKSTET